jgi:predicted DNA-binding transcriptional regulator AlpA
MKSECSGSCSMAPELLTLDQAAELCGLGSRTLWRYAHCGIAPQPIKIGPGLRGASRFRRAELLTWIEAGCPRCDKEGGR